jgi:transcriptional regulator with XRE-family HTH domain
MATHIRAIRKQRGLTLQQLADRVQTSPQTIQRLETGAMSVSVDWLQRIASALDLTPAQLLDGPTRSYRVRLIAELDGGESVDSLLAMVGAHGAGFEDMAKPAQLDAGHVDLPTAGDDSVAVKLVADVGPFAAGTVLLARKQSLGERVAHQCDCLVALANGHIVLRRAAVGDGDGITIVGYRDQSHTVPTSAIAWIAPIIGTVYPGMYEHTMA